MASVKAAIFCPGCQIELPGPVDECPTCHKVLRLASSEFFEVPYYMASQMRDYAESVENRLTQKKPLTEEELKRFETIKNDYELFVRMLPSAEKLAALVDAQLVLRQALHSKIDPGVLKEIIGRGVAIGNLATALSNYFKCGGSLSEPETKFVPAEPRDEGRSASSTPRGWD